MRFHRISTVIFNFHLFYSSAIAFCIVENFKFDFTKTGVRLGLGIDIRYPKQNFESCKIQKSTKKN